MTPPIKVLFCCLRRGPAILDPVPLAWTDYFEKNREEYCRHVSSFIYGWPVSHDGVDVVRSDAGFIVFEGDGSLAPGEDDLAGTWREATREEIEAVANMRDPFGENQP